MEETENEAFVCMMVHCDAFRCAQRKETHNTCACICGALARTDEGIKIAREMEVKEGWRSMKVHFLIKYSGLPPELQRICLPGPGHHRRGTAVSECVPGTFPQPFGPPSLCGSCFECGHFNETRMALLCVPEEFSSSSRPSPLLQCCSGISSLCFDFLLSTRSSTSGVIRHIHSGISERRGQM